MTDATINTAQAGPLTAGARITEIDILRGLVIVLMALDHVRDYFHAAAFAYDPLDVTQTNPLLYATRWITHLCAPTFVFLAGVSAYLQVAKGKSTPGLAWFLLTRGVWLVVLEMTLISFAWSFAFPFVVFLQVIWAIGWAMIALAGLVWLPRLAVLAIGVAIVAGHNLLDPLTAEQFGSFSVLWRLLHDGGLLVGSGGPYAIAAYPILPWVGVMALGYGLGAVFMRPPAQREREIFIAGLIMLAAFVVLRAFNLYGEPHPWSLQADWGANQMAFLNVTKYPPSLHFTLVTLGVVFTLWPLLARLRGPVVAFFSTFGAVPFFFYLLHLYLVHLLAIGANAAMGRDVSGMFDFLVKGFTGHPSIEGLGFTLLWVYVAWIAVLALLYPLCRWWAALKKRRRDWWLSYL